MALMDKYVLAEQCYECTIDLPVGTFTVEVVAKSPEAAREAFVSLLRQHVDVDGPFAIEGRPDSD